MAEVDLSAIAHNLGVVKEHIGPGRSVCAVVKADAYGHGALAVGRCALEAGAAMLAVAQPVEGAELRAGGVDAPILVLSEPVNDEEVNIVALAGLAVTVHRAEVVEALAGTATALDVHLKVDTGMNRVGARPGEVVDLSRLILRHPRLRLASVWTHCAVADVPADPFTAAQLRRYDDVLAALADAGIDAGWRHAANTAVALAHPAGRYDMVRLGIGLYGIAPSDALAATPGVADLRPALRWSSTVSFVKRVGAGEGISYGRTHVTRRATTIATVPVGYADGLVRRWATAGGRVVIGGRCCPIAGTITMDQTMIDCGDDEVSVGDEVVLIGAQGQAALTVDEMARAVGTIGYEILTGIGARVARVHSKGSQGSTGAL